MTELARCGSYCHLPLNTNLCCSCVGPKACLAALVTAAGGAVVICQAECRSSSAALYNIAAHATAGHFCLYLPCMFAQAEDPEIKRQNEMAKANLEKAHKTGHVHRT